MMSNTLLKLFAGAVLAGAVPAFAQAQNMTYAVRSPVAITSFRINERYVSGTVGTDLEQPPQLVAGDVRITFRNTANVGAAAVKFAVDDGASTQSRKSSLIKEHFARASRSSTILYSMTTVSNERTQSAA
jgi:hypothetical protein